MQGPSHPRSGAVRPAAALALGAGALLVLTVIGLIIARARVEAYLRSEQFRSFAADKAGRALHANATFVGLKAEGLDFFCEHFRAEGAREASFSILELQQPRASVSLRRFFEGIWQVDHVSAQRLDLHLNGARIAAPVSPRPDTTPHASQNPGGWMPTRVEIGGATIREVNFSWGDGPTQGSLTGSQLAATPREQGAWSLKTAGGRFLSPGLPPLQLNSAQVLYRQPTVFLQTAVLESPAAPAGESGGPGSIRVSGEIAPTAGLNLQCELTRVSVTPFLPEDWRARLHGNLTGELTARGPDAQSLKIDAKLQLHNARIEALPVLDKIALFTRLQQYRQLSLSKASAECTKQGGRLEVRNFLAESSGLIRIEGRFSVQDEKIDGFFQVGVTPASLQWLPGSQEKIFTEARDGYVWTPMRLEGPVQNPADDLSPRLAAAAQAAIVEKAQDGAVKTIRSGVDAAKSVLDSLLK